MEETNVKPSEPTAKMADCTPGGLVGLAISCFCFFALLCGFVNATAMPIMACWLLGGFVVQITTALVDLKNGGQAGGSTFLYFSAFFMLATALSMLIKSGVIGGGVAYDARIEGWAWIVLAFIVILWTPAFFKGPGQLFLICVFVDIAAPLIALRDLGILPSAVSTAFGYIAGIALLICGILGIWLASATIVNNAYGKEVYPTLKSFYKPKQ